MTTEQAAEIIKLLRSIDITGWIALGLLGAILGSVLPIPRKSKTDKN